MVKIYTLQHFPGDYFFSSCFKIFCFSQLFLILLWEMSLQFITAELLSAPSSGAQKSLPFKHKVHKLLRAAGTPSCSHSQREEVMHGQKITASQ